MNADELFDDIVEDLAVRGASAGNMFGARALKSGKKAFGCLLKSGDLAVRLGAGTSAHAEALKLDGAELFDPSGLNQPFKDWVVVPAAHSDRWLHFAEAGLDYLVG
jgi:hypothetical protein